MSSLREDYGDIGIIALINEVLTFAWLLFRVYLRGEPKTTKGELLLFMETVGILIRFT